MLESLGEGESATSKNFWIARKGRENQVPFLLQDAITRMLHFILSLPVNIDKGKFTQVDL
jgi:hypothetical protein